MAIGKVIKKGEGGESSVNPDRPVLRPARAGVMNAEVFEARQSAQNIVEDAHRERERMLAEAQAECERMIAETQRECEHLKAKSRDDGRQEGLAQSTELVLRAKMQAGQILSQYEKDVIALSCKMAEKIIGRDLERSPDVLIEICANAIEQLRSARSVVLRVHPRTAAVLRARKPELMEFIGRAVDVAIKEDPEVDPVGCVVQTEFGTVDAQLPTQFEMLQNVLLPDAGGGRREGPA